MNNNSLLFFTNNDIPFTSAKMIMHNPTIKELSLIGEKTFRVGVHLILFLAKDVRNSDKFDLSNKEDFEIFIEVINNKELKDVNYKETILQLFSLIFPNYKTHIRKNDIQCISLDENSNISFIDKTNFKELQEIILKTFYVEGEEGGGYNPADLRAEKIAKKLNERKKKKSESSSEISVYKRYASILSIGLKLDLNVILNYTVNQLEVQFKRYMLESKWNAYYEAKLAGATGLDEAEDWTQDI